MRNMNPILKVTSADYIRNYVLRLSFNDGTTKLVDFWPLAQKGICTKLQDLDYFRNYSLEDRNRIADTLLAEIRMQMVKDAVLIETAKF